MKKENAYKEYIKAIKQQRKNQFLNWENYVNIFTINSLKECFKINSNTSYSPICSLIDNSFRWASTKEGHDFWSALDEKWFDKMQNTKIIPEKLTHK